MSSTLLDAFSKKSEHLDTANHLLQSPDIQEEMDSRQIGTLRGQVTTTTKWLMDFGPVVDELKNVLDTQREVACSMGFERLPHDTDHKRRQTMEKQPATPFIYAQRAFSLPEDYTREPHDFRENSEQYMRSLVFQPELFSDEFLMGLELMDKSDRVPSFIRNGNRREIHINNIRAKIACIDAAKDILAHAVPLPLGTYATGRILYTTQGKYIVFQKQELPLKDENEKVNKNKGEIQYIAKVYNTLYSLLRSQDYGREGLRESAALLQDILVDLDLLYTGWDSLSLDEKNHHIATIVEKFGDSQIPEIASAKSRLSGIVHKHRVQDMARIQGATNDIRKKFLTQDSKQATFQRQGNSILPLLRSEEVRFDFLRKNLFTTLTKLDENELKKVAYNQGELSPHTKEKINQAFHVLTNFVHVSSNSGFVGEPFQWFNSRLAGQLQMSASTDKEKLSTLLKIILALKMQSYRLGLHQMLHALKTGQKTPKQLIPTLHALRDLLLERSFFASVELTEQGKARFSQMITHVSSLSRGCARISKTDAIKRIESLIEDLPSIFPSSSHS